MNLEIDYDLDTLLGHVALDYKLTLGENATGDTPMYWGNLVSGTAYLTYRDENGRDNLIPGQYYFNSGADQNIPVFTTSYFNVYGRKKTSSSAPVVSVTSTGITLSGNNGWDYYCSLPFYDTNNRGAVSVSFTSSSYPTFYGNLSSTYYGNWSYLGKTDFNSVNYTNIPALHDSNSDIPYIPISGVEMSYNDLRQYIVNEYNEQNPSETISVDDLPAFDEDETEPTYDIQPFSIDYDEILGEREMESIIAETRYILDTTPYEIESLDYQQAISEPYEEIKKIAVLDSDTKTAMSKIYDVAERMTRNDFLPLYAFSAILSIIMWFVFRR